MAKKQLTPEEISQIATDLQNSQSTKRKSAAKKVGKNQLTALGDSLYEAYIKERGDKRTWETQTEMILALGRIGYTKALPDLELIIDRNEPHDMITIAAARSYVRLKRSDLTDAKPVIDLLKNGKLSVLNGATDILAFDEMKPLEEDIKTIISLLNSKDEKEIAIPGLGDPRESLLTAMSKWKDPGSQAYLKRFAESTNRGLKECAELALSGKKSRYE
ncbi:hypothetical protein [Bacteroides sp. 224]|uniref:hypothetical protein n=1 Tax=Bacteroides sp. 224 TaxID=2302936 RepID=UPI0013D276B9|nr:hypothetical protein [Bacteroides sp. 224]NDV66665.1 hypothetical protein [Bacteroides sp. 224]